MEFDLGDKNQFLLQKSLNKANIASFSSKQEYKKKLMNAIAISELLNYEGEGEENFPPLKYFQDSQDPF
jgi:hypothetical protein